MGEDVIKLRRLPKMAVSWDLLFQAHGQKTRRLLDALQESAILVLCRIRVPLLKNLIASRSLIGPKSNSENFRVNDLVNNKAYETSMAFH